MASLHSDESQADALGLQVPVYLDEWGWLAGPYQMPGGEWDLTAEQRRSYFAPMLNGVEADPPVAGDDWYTWVTDGPWSFTSADLAAFTAAVQRDSIRPAPRNRPHPGAAADGACVEPFAMRRQQRGALSEASLRAGRVVLSGATAPAFRGARVRVTISGSSRTLATASVGTNGRFTASVPAPRVPARARYVVRAAGSVSAPLALMHRLSAYATVGRGEMRFGGVCAGRLGAPGRGCGLPGGAPAGAGALSPAPGSGRTGAFAMCCRLCPRAACSCCPGASGPVRATRRAWL